MSQQLLLTAPLRCTHPTPGRPGRQAHPRGHCRNDCGLALLGAASEPLSAFCSEPCLQEWQGRQPAECAACGTVHAGRCLESIG